MPKTTNTDPTVGTFVSTNEDPTVTCDFCRQPIPLGAPIIQDFVTCCEPCDIALGEEEDAEEGR